MKYRENIEDSTLTKQTYLDGLERIILSRQKEFAYKRSEYCKNIFVNQEDYRDDLKKMLGWPLVDHDDGDLPFVKATKLSDEGHYSIYRMQFEILDGLELSGLYFKMNTETKKPLVLVQHGGLGTPEVISGMYESTGNYNRMLERVIAHGVHAFAPQLLLWDKKYGVPHERVNIDARLKRVGSSITAIELYGLVRILDYFEAQDNISNFGMVGLSYGGFYTLLLAAIDTRIKSAISCAFFNTRDQYPWSDWTWFGSARQFDDAELACLTYPRKLCIEIGTKDDVFNYIYGEASFDRLTELCKGVGMDWLTFIKFEGKHEFCLDDGPIQALVKHISDDI